MRIRWAFLGMLSVVLVLDVLWAVVLRLTNALTTQLDINGLLFYLFFGGVASHLFVIMFSELSIWKLECQNDFEAILFDIACAPVSLVIISVLGAFVVGYVTANVGWSTIKYFLFRNA